MLIYDGDGLLSTQEMDHIRSAIDEGYPFAVEVRKFPESTWSEEKLQRRTYQVVGEGWGTRDYQTRTGAQYRLIRKTGTLGGFMMLKDRNDWDAVVYGRSDLVIKSRPFRSILS